MDWAGLKVRFAAIADTVWGWFRAAIKLMTAFVGASLMIAVAVIGVAWLILFGQQVLPNHIIEVTPVEQQRQWSAGRTAHDSIKAWVPHCVGTNFVSELPYNLQLIFSGRPSLYVPEELRKSESKKNPTVQEMNAVQLSNSMLNQRLELGRKASDSYLQLQYIQWFIIFIGLVTTVVVSVSSTELFGKVDTPRGKWLRFLAIRRSAPPSPRSMHFITRAMIGTKQRIRSPISRNCTAKWR